MTLGGRGVRALTFTLYTSLNCGSDRVYSCCGERAKMKLKQTTLFGTVAGVSTDCIYANPKSKT